MNQYPSIIKNSQKDIIAKIPIKKKTPHGYIILGFERFIELFLYITVGCISGISLLLPGYYYKWLWHRIPESDTAISYSLIFKNFAGYNILVP